MNSVKTCLILSCLLVTAACNKHSAPTGPVRHYAVTGKIVALDEKHQTATIDAAAIPNYMEAMTMDYPIESKDDFRSLKVGEKISGRLDVASDETYTLTNIKPAQ